MMLLSEASLEVLRRMMNGWRLYGRSTLSSSLKGSKLVSPRGHEQLIPVDWIHTMENEG